MAQVPGRDELILESIINDTEYGDLPKSRIEYLLLQLKAKMGSLTVDSQLSTTSENPVQNKVITGALNGLGALAHKDSASTTFTPTLTTSVSNGALTVSFSQDTITVT